ncbi:MAG: nucleotidyltransferase domain-containing protein [Candidatus Aenigmarchaeota archaeon]|nr:nucleotidyltransferase domain-containing protein [Candidatus Aenigmarchaeota archaeon]
MVKKVTSKTDVKERILNLFFSNSTRKFHIREVASLTGVAPRTAKKYLDNLRERKFLILKKEKLYDSYSADTESVIFRDAKFLYNVKKLRDSGLVGYIERKLNYPAIVLYGSASRGEDIENSDIDIFVVAKKCGNLDVSRFENDIGKKVHVMCMSEKDFKSGRNKELINNVINGFVLSGFLEVFG